MFGPSKKQLKDKITELEVRLTIFEARYHHDMDKIWEVFQHASDQIAQLDITDHEIKRIVMHIIDQQTTIVEKLIGKRVEDLMDDVDVPSTEVH